MANIERLTQLRIALEALPQDNLCMTSWQDQLVDDLSRNRRKRLEMRVVFLEG